jgi:hypothetical protein
MASFTDNKALWAIMILTLAGTYVWYKKTKEAFEASEVKWEETSAPYADEYEQNVMDPKEVPASATFGPDVSLVSGIPTLDGANMPFVTPTQPLMAYLANGSLAPSLPSLNVRRA